MNLAETRILAVGIETLISEKKSTTLAWFYFPDLRDYLAKQLLAKPLGKDILNLENIFTERYFSSNVYKESNVYDREIADYNTGIPTIMGSLLVEMQTLDTELEYWFKK